MDMATLWGDGPTPSEIHDAIAVEARTLSRIESGELPSSNPNYSSAARERIESLQQKLPDSAIGRAVQDSRKRYGYVTDSRVPEHSISIIGANGLEAVTVEYEIAFSDSVMWLDNFAIADMFCDDAPPTPSLLGVWRRQALEAQNAAKNERARLSQAADDARAAYASEARAKMPIGAVAVIVACLMEDKSDHYSDYFNSVSTDQVILAWSSTERDNFAEMRKAARNSELTAHLADLPPSAEHREKYSMGRGYYLMSDDNTYSGWQVRKMRIGATGFPVHGAAWSIPEASGVATVASGAPIASGAAARQTQWEGRFTVQEHVHTLKGFTYWLCVPRERLERSEYDSALSTAKAAGGYYSRAWGQIPGGFAFKDKAAAFQFAGVNDDPRADEQPAATAPRAPISKPASAGAGASDKLRTMAASLDSSIADCFRERLANTPKRAKQAGQARNEGLQLQRARVGMVAIADAIDAGTLPDALAGVRSKGEICELAREAIDYSQGGYYSTGRLTGKPAAGDDSDKGASWFDPVKAARAAALWGLIASAGGADDSQAKAATLKAKIDALKFHKIDGYFPTPLPVVQMMLDRAGVCDGDKVLEPSAGSGNIADALRDAGAAVECIECNSGLAEILREKGFAVDHGDFMSRAPDSAALFDKIVMNPPFEKAQDVDHVLHAWQFLKPGGRLVAIMSASVEFAQTAKIGGFRQQVERIGGQIEKLPDGSFKESGTGVAAVIVTLWKD